ncbi:hypothetical protein [Ottowia testudinis]|uniref:Uncharacterized protein n=1 Tax=Ottowia testudinis TaxID=2816950 RepID=A0A975CKE9_9BURK|nr:hypothetical protein [Ottowia testudinis]QTD46706.1 hypothetical protein J1M35_07490 [Ottowia testudinis]
MSSPQPYTLCIAGAGFEGATVQVSELPQLQRLLALLEGPRLLHPAPDDDASALPSWPHEDIWADALGWAGLPAHQRPWAALNWSQERELPTTHAWLTLTHWQLDFRSARALHPAALPLTETQGSILARVCDEYLQPEGLRVDQFKRHTWLPHTWLLSGEGLTGLGTAPVHGLWNRPAPREALAFSGPDAKRFQRLTHELEMHLSQHPGLNQVLAQVNPRPNGVLIHGAGTLRAIPSALERGHRFYLEDRLLPSATQGEAAAHAQAWQLVDDDCLTSYVTGVEDGLLDLTLILTGPRQALQWCGSKPSALRQWRRRWANRWRAQLTLVLGDL